MCWPQLTLILVSSRVFYCITFAEGLHFSAFHFYLMLRLKWMQYTPFHAPSPSLGNLMGLEFRVVSTSSPHSHEQAPPPLWMGWWVSADVSTSSHSEQGPIVPSALYPVHVRVL